MNPVVRLDKIHRQDDASDIIEVAHAILAGHDGLPSAVDSLDRVNPKLDFTFVCERDGAAASKLVLELCSNRLRRWYPGIDPVMDVQVLSPMRKGDCGITQLNSLLQSTLNPQNRAERSSGGAFQIGDKVIQTRNDYGRGLFNGDIGRIASIEGPGSLEVEFDGTSHVLDRSGLSDLQLAYSISIHKSQGSEFRVVIVPLLRQHFVMLQRNLIYTAVTRARDKVFVVGDPSAWSRAVKTADAVDRKTALFPRICKALNHS